MLQEKKTMNEYLPTVSRIPLVIKCFVMDELGTIDEVIEA